MVDGRREARGFAAGQSLAEFALILPLMFVIFVDRDFSGVSVFFNGDTGILELEGTIYNPWGDVKVNGGAGDTVAAQIIAYTIKITGNGGFTVTYQSDGVVQLNGAGLVK